MRSRAVLRGEIIPVLSRPLIGQYLIIPGCDWLLVVTCDDVMLSLHNRNVGGGKQTLGLGWVTLIK